MIWDIILLTYCITSGSLAIVVSILFAMMLTTDKLDNMISDEKDYLHRLQKIRTVLRYRHPIVTAFKLTLGVVIVFTLTFLGWPFFLMSR